MYWFNQKWQKILWHFWINIFRISFMLFCLFFYYFRMKTGTRNQVPSIVMGCASFLFFTLNHCNLLPLKNHHFLLSFVVISLYTIGRYLKMKFNLEIQYFPSEKGIGCRKKWTTNFFEHFSNLFSNSLLPYIRR